MKFDQEIDVSLVIKAIELPQNGSFSKPSRRSDLVGPNKRDDFFKVNCWLAILTGLSRC